MSETVAMENLTIDPETLAVAASVAAPSTSTTSPASNTEVTQEWVDTVDTVVDTAQDMADTPIQVTVDTPSQVTVDTPSQHTVVAVNQESTAPTRKSKPENFSKTGFFLNSLGLAVGVGNILRFPYKLNQHGGKPFLIAYCVMFVAVGLPMLVLENSLGQYSGLGPTEVFGQMVPKFRGLGFCMIFIRMIVNSYSPVVMAWSIYYLVATFFSLSNDLPWTGCNNTSWNTANCSTGITMPADEYFKYYVLNSQKEWHDIMTFNFLKLAGSLLVAWLSAFFFLFKGPKLMEKLTYPAVLIPYLVLFAMILYPAFASLHSTFEDLDYAGMGSNGTKPFIWQNVFTDLDLWADAASQIIFSLGIGYGSVINTARFQDDFYKSTMWHSLIIGVLNAVTSFWAGGVVFTFLGLLAKKSGVDMDDLIQGDIGLVLIVFPSAFSNDEIMSYPVGVTYSILFFLTLALLALSSLIGGIKVFWDFFIDAFPRCKDNKKWTLFWICFAKFLFGLQFCSPAGFYLYGIYDEYCCNSLLIICLLENLHIAWAFTPPFGPLWSMKKWLDLLADMKMDTNSGFWKRLLRGLLILFWRFLTPTLLLGSVGYNFYKRSSVGLGMIIEIIAILIFVVFFVASICKKEKPKEAWRVRFLKEIAALVDISDAETGTSDSLPMKESTDTEKTDETNGQFDVEKALDDIDENELSEMDADMHLQRADVEKNKGNEYFKAGNYDKAIRCYTRGMQCDPKNAILPTNRAMAYLETESWRQAEADCSLALSLDGGYVKAYQKRATARKNLKEYAKALEDLNHVLLLKPNSKQTKSKIEELALLKADQETVANKSATEDQTVVEETNL